MNKHIRAILFFIATSPILCNGVASFEQFLTEHVLPHVKTAGTYTFNRYCNQDCLGKPLVRMVASYGTARIMYGKVHATRWTPVHDSLMHMCWKRYKPNEQLDPSIFVAKFFWHFCSATRTLLSGTHNSATKALITQELKERARNPSAPISQPTQDVINHYIKKVNLSSQQQQLNYELVSGYYEMQDFEAGVDCAAKICYGMLVPFLIEKYASKLT